MLIAIILILATVANLILLRLYRRSDNGLIAVTALANRNLNDYCDSLESEVRCLIAENRRQGLRIDELESRLRRLQARQSLGLRAYDVGVGGLYMRHVEGVN